MLFPVAISITSGFLVAFVTGLILGTKKAKIYPGGSLAAGLGTAVTYSLNDWSIAACALAGLFGWILYCLVVKYLPAGKP